MLALILALLAEGVDGQQVIVNVVAQLAVLGGLVQHGLHLAQLGSRLGLHEARLLGFADAVVELVNQGKQAQNGDQRQEGRKKADLRKVFRQPRADLQGLQKIGVQHHHGGASRHGQGGDGEAAPQLAVQAVLDDVHGAAQEQIEHRRDEGADALQQQLLHGRDVQDGPAQPRRHPDADHLGAGKEDQPQRKGQQARGPAALITGEGQEQIDRGGQQHALAGGQAQPGQDDQNGQNRGRRQPVQSEVEARLKQRFHQGDIAELDAEPDEQKGGCERGQGQGGHLS